MKVPKIHTVILWASYYDELAAITFAHEFRQMGLAVLVVATHNQDEQRRGAFIDPCRKNLAEVIANVEQIACLIVPSSAAALGQFQQDPLLWQLINAVHVQGGKIVIGRTEGQVDAEICHRLSAIPSLIYYPRTERLLLFARWLARGIVQGDPVEVARAAGEKPPQVRVAANSDPRNVAGAIAGIVREYGFAEAQSVGAAAGNQMLKATAIAKGYLTADNLCLFAMPDYVTIDIGGQRRSAIRLFVSAWPVGMDNWIEWEQVHSLVAADDD